MKKKFLQFAYYIVYILVAVVAVSAYSVWVDTRGEEKISSWVEFKNRDEDFSILLPSLPKTSVQNSRSESTNEPLIQNVFMAFDGDIAYSVAFTKLPALLFQQFKENPKAFLASLPESALIGFPAGKVVQADLIEFKGYSAVEFIIEIDSPKKARSHSLALFVPEGETYWMQIVATGDSMDEIQSDKFFNSFKQLN